MNKPLLLALLLATGLVGCNAERISNIPSYKLKVVQGNELDPRTVASLQPGMSREQVQALLGTPLLRPAFRSNQWDYTFEISRNGIIQELRNLTLTFQNDQLVKAEGDAIEYAINQLKARYGEQAVQQQSAAQTQSAPEPIWAPDR
ncbi:MAG: outer membrane protein assembly factor BamE [Neisseria sp.]|uniref:outer membrane protein assembly factor BamE n=1 Tax=Neisseria sp. TaxID=192066 RepID=UPI0026DD6F59|nr:outer membrane protein assembly factor BamE [Neisseria sp.]MDO4641320.1 outer membrane protein assembly factor BamE [Neisseria sp.]